MKQEKLNEVLSEMLSYLNNEQTEQLKRVLEHTFYNCEIVEKTYEKAVSAFKYLNVLF